MKYGVLHLSPTTWQCREIYTSAEPQSCTSLMYQTKHLTHVFGGRSRWFSTQYILHRESWRRRQPAVFHLTGSSRIRKKHCSLGLSPCLILCRVQLCGQRITAFTTKHRARQSNSSRLRLAVQFGVVVCPLRHRQVSILQSPPIKSEYLDLSGTIPSSSMRRVLSGISWPACTFQPYDNTAPTAKSVPISAGQHQAVPRHQA